MQDYSHLNQFGSLIEDFERVERGEVVVEGIPSFYVQNSYRTFKDALLSSQRFIGPDLGFTVLGEDGLFEKKHLDLTRLPFDSVAVLYEVNWQSKVGEIVSTPVVTLYQCGKDTNRDVFCRSAFRYPNNLKINGQVPWVLWPKACVLTADPELRPTADGIGCFSMSAFNHPESEPPDAEDDLRVRVAQVLVDLSCALACRNVVAREVAVPEKISMRRAKAGKKPLFSYRVLEIDRDPTAPATGACIADRASPRTHLRRGHIRRLASGNLVWVNAALVRGQTPGIVVKDYRV